MLSLGIRYHLILAEEKREHVPQVLPHALLTMDAGPLHATMCPLSRDMYCWALQARACCHHPACIQSRQLISRLRVPRLASGRTAATPKHGHKIYIN